MWIEVTAGPRLVIGVLSAEGHEERRRACRETWLSATARLRRVDHVFIVGRPSACATERVGDVLFVPYGDAYESLSKKTAAWCAWAASLSPPPDVLFKCDDDTYVALDRLLEYVATAAWGEYGGRDLGPRLAERNGDRFGRGLPGFAGGGGGYLLSLRAARIAAEALLEAPPHPAEDILVARALHDRGVAFVPSERFVHFGRESPRLGPDDDLITTHYASPDEMAAIHASFQIPPGGSPSDARS